MAAIADTTNIPSCPSCHKLFIQGEFWIGANFCRGLFLLGFIEDSPGISAWELSELTGMSYQNASRGLTKLRDHQVVEFRSEERDNGGIRYRHYPLEDAEKAREGFALVVRQVEASPYTRAIR